MNMNEINVVVSDDAAIVEIPASDLIYEWRRHPEQSRKGFEVEVYVEGYRPGKETWLYETYEFKTLEEALRFHNEISWATSKEREKLLGFETREKYGGYCLMFNYMEVYEYNEQGKFRWIRS